MTHVSDLYRIDDKVALVTGGAGIVGRPISEALAEAGAIVIVASRDKVKCCALADEMKTAGLRAEGEELDLASENAILKLRDRVLKKYGRLDVLFNNAVARVGRNFEQTSADDWEATMRVNSSGLFLACQAFSKLMQRQRSGSIVNISSIYGLVGPDFAIYEGTPLTNAVDYAFAKGGMLSLTRYLASYLGPYNVRVNCISLGGVRTAETPAAFVPNYSRRTLLGRMADSLDIKGPAVFLASDASRYVTGQNIAVDGGWSCI